MRRRATISEALPRAVVAIPARDEEERLAACLAALAEQVDRGGYAVPKAIYGVLVLLNNCGDGSAAIARRIAKTYPVPLRIVERRLPESRANAGGARRLAMDLAAGWLADPDGLLLTTDADTRVSPTWISDNLAAFDAGVDAVAGSISLDPEEDALLPPALHERGRLEAAYGDRLIEIAALLDPEPHNPWPHHATASGATLGVSLSAYRRIGGLPALPLGEDKALVAALLAHDARVRFAPEVRVVTSGRLFGRAPGGTAETMRLRSEDPLALCDESLEPAADAFARAKWRGRLRDLYARGRIHESAFVTDPRRRFKTFGALWQDIEARRFARRRLTPDQLPRQIAIAEAALRRLRPSLVPPSEVEPEFLESLLPDNPRELTDPV